MSRRQVTCISKRGNHHHAHERISSIGGSGWKLSEDDAIKTIEGGKDEFYVSAGGRTVDVVVATHKGRKYLKTTADSYSPDNLLSLPECS
jgi:hypothetical protein